MESSAARIAHRLATEANSNESKLTAILESELMLLRQVDMQTGYVRGMEAAAKICDEADHNYRMAATGENVRPSVAANLAGQIRRGKKQPMVIT